MNNSNEVDELQLRKTAQEQKAMIRELNDAPTIYEWSRVAEPYTPFKVMAAFSGLIFIISGMMLTLEYQSLMPILICSSIGF